MSASAREVWDATIHPWSRLLLGAEKFLKGLELDVDPVVVDVSQALSAALILLDLIFVTEQQSLGCMIV